QHVVKGKALLQKLLVLVSVDHSASPFSFYKILPILLDCRRSVKWRQGNRTFITAFSSRTSAPDIAQTTLLAGNESDGLSRHTRRQIVHLEGRDVKILPQLIHSDGIADEVGIANIVHMTVDIGIAVVHSPMIRRRHLLGQFEPGEALVLTQLAPVGTL